MALFGRFHLVRVVLATVFLVLLYTIVTKFDAHNSLIRLPTSMLDAESLTIKELSKLSMANETCPVCFGRDACEELFEDMANGALKVSRTVITPKDLDQTVQAVYRKGRVRFWMRSQPSSPSLLKGFENYLCRKGKLEFIIFLFRFHEFFSVKLQRAKIKMPTSRTVMCPWLQSLRHSCTRPTWSQMRFVDSTRPIWYPAGGSRSQSAHHTS